MDKVLHFIVGVGIFSSLYFLHHSWAWIAVILAAFGKEVYDHFHQENHTPDIWDAMVTIVGGLTAHFSLLALQRLTGA